jgi:hypothetical protein
MSDEEQIRLEAVVLTRQHGRIQSNAGPFFLNFGINQGKRRDLANL